ncbi:9980_t:CDS:10 [Paraglomus brasilianum]|uniref:Pre-mRNA-splicing factor n=1 Tax=Paraglomus brasilianum TaxID=144538 RepID=A0A9N9CF52_9GLOM|nr:9980_t:CDS:10 [Paraglomus brasilianum]
MSDRKTTLPPHAPPTESTRGGLHHPTLHEIQTDSISSLARTYWTSKEPSEREWLPVIVEQIYCEELENKRFETRKLMLLEFSQYLEKYLWPNYNADNATLAHVLSIVLMVIEKFRERVAAWDIFVQLPDEFPKFFNRVLHLAIAPVEEISLQMKRFLLIFLIHAFQSLENPLVRVECMRVVSVSIWHCFAMSSRREQEFKLHSHLRKVWKRSTKKLEEAVSDDALAYCERFIEFMIDLEAQLPTRRYFNALLDDHQLIVLCTLSPLMKRKEGNELFKQLLEILKFYAGFEIHDHTGLALTDDEMTELHCKKLTNLQHIAFQHFGDKLKLLALANLSSIERRPDLYRHFNAIDHPEIIKLCELLNIRTTRLNDNSPYDKDFLIEVLIGRFEKRTSQIDAINAMPLYPDENALFDDAVVKTQFYSGETPLALPKLNLQFLTLHDYLLRNFNLFRLESTYEIRQDVEDVVKRLAPRISYPSYETEFSGWARMAVEIERFSIVEVAKPNLGESKPSQVKADITFNIGRYTESIRNEWDSLKQHDVLFLLTIQAHEQTGEKYQDDMPFRSHFGLKYVRGCEISAIIGDDGKPIDEVGKPRVEDRRPKISGNHRTIRVLLDTNQYQIDISNYSMKKEEDVYETFNVLMRRKPKENNFKAVLETIRDLMQSELVVPEWLHNIFLGYGDPGSAHYTWMPSLPKEIDFHDTFLDYNHLKESFPGMMITPAEGFTEPIPPYVLRFPDVSESLPPVRGKAGERGNRSEMKLDQKIITRTYTLPNMGPYPFNQPRKNIIKFTPVQVEAIRAGTNPGLTMVVGPPGTGKTDVAVQIIANLYRNFPDQHTLLVTHSNQALNQLFEKIMALDVDERHLLRLGHGEEELNTELSFSKYGRVNSFLEKRLALLEEVDRLAKSLDIGGEHGYTCETAGYFYLYHILSRWEPYIDKVRQGLESGNGKVEMIRDEFPFMAYFANAPQPLFPPDANYSETVEIAEGCFRHLEKIFTELEEIRGFELLRTSYDRANYLLTKEAKIIAMTCTHAALKRRELASLGFKYDNVVMEEAAQILEVETFIPLLLQDPEDGRSRLKRVILIGDHNQLPPVVKNMAFQQYGNMEQSLFTRFVRLGVPTVDLDAQGRARPPIAKLYNWRYKNLGDLPVITKQEEYQRANAGFTYEYQLINVGNYMGKGETEPVPYFYQNLGEAEFIVAVYQYMRLLGYPAEKISILTTYNGQKALIRDVLNKRCSWNPLFGRPAKVATVDKFQGQQNDYILLSLVRTRSVGHIRDVRRLIVAMSRARLGLYVFCRRALFENCYELTPTLNQLLQRPDKLMLELNEMWPSQRDVENHDQPFTIDSVEHIGQYVYQMMKEQLDYAKQQKTELEQGMVVS